MLQIVFSDSECGSLKLATHWGPSSWDDGPIGFIFGDGEREPTQEEKDQAMAQLKAQWEAENRRARPVGGDPGDVLCPSVGLDIGPISGPDVEKARFDLLTAWLGAISHSQIATRTIMPSEICFGNNASGTESGFWRVENTARLCESGTATHLTPCVGFMMCFGNYGTVTAL